MWPSVLGRVTRGQENSVRKRQHGSVLVLPVWENLLRTDHGRHKVYHSIKPPSMDVDGYRVYRYINSGFRVFFAAHYFTSGSMVLAELVGGVGGGGGSSSSVLPCTLRGVIFFETIGQILFQLYSFDTVKPVFKTTWEIGTTWELRTATSVPRSIHYIEMDLRNKTTSEFRTVIDSLLDVPNSQVSLY